MSSRVIIKAKVLIMKDEKALFIHYPYTSEVARPIVRLNHKSTDLARSFYTRQRNCIALGSNS